MALLFITHDLPLAAITSDRMLVMHAGQVVEDAPTARLVARPRHPYTARLLAAVPAGAAQLDAIAPIPGSLPDLRSPPSCRYRERCTRSEAACDGPLVMRDEAGHRFACRNPEEAA
jgi:oligopeptide/dipeptide ABC transporter ATP-binding protein